MLYLNFKPDIGIGEESILLIRVEEREVLHNDGHQQVQHWGPAQAETKFTVLEVLSS